MKGKKEVRQEGREIQRYRGKRERMKKEEKEKEFILPMMKKVDQKQNMTVIDIS